MTMGGDSSTITSKAAVLADVCAALSDNKPNDAAGILRDRYPFVPLANVGRSYTIRQALDVFIRDGFIDRYSGERLICPATLRLISKRLPEAFPFHANWRTDASHFGYWELCPTVDHVMPVSRGGTDDESNWVTTSMVRNAAKSNFTLDELGWPPPKRPGKYSDWDGLTGWFLAQAAADRAILNDHYMRAWFSAAREHSTNPNVF